MLLIFPQPPSCSKQIQRQYPAERGWQHSSLFWPWRQPGVKRPAVQRVPGFWQPPSGRGFDSLHFASGGGGGKGVCSLGCCGNITWFQQRCGIRSRLSSSPLSRREGSGWNEGKCGAHKGIWGPNGEIQTPGSRQRLMITCLSISNNTTSGRCRQSVL